MLGSLLALAAVRRMRDAWVTVYYYGDDGKLKSLSLDPTYYCKVTAKAGYKAERYY